MSDLTSSAAILSSSLNSVGTSIANTNLNKTNRKWSEKMANQAYARQQELTLKAPTLQKIGLIDAGISPAAMNGYSSGIPTVNTASSPSTLQEFQPLDFSSVLQGLMTSKQMDNLDANTAKTNADAEAQKLENEKTRNEMNAWSSATSESYYLDDRNNKHFITDKDFDSWARDYVHTHGSLPDLVKTGGALSENAAKVMSSLSNFKATIAQSGMYEAQSLLAKKVAELKLADSSVMKSIYKLDEATYNNLMAQIAKVRSDIDVNETVKALNNAKTSEARQSVLESVARTALIKSQDKALKNSSVNNLIDQLGGDKSTKDNLITVGKIILSLIAGFTHASI